jgi:hypothetical protein
VAWCDRAAHGEVKEDAVAGSAAAVIAWRAMPTTKLPVARALLGATFAALLSGCALIFNYGNYEESGPAGGGAGGGAGGSGATSTGTGGCAASGADAGFGPVKWVQTFSSSSPSSLDFAHSLAVSPEGEVYFTAQFEGNVTLGADQIDTSDAYVLALAKIDELGEPVWSKKLGERTPIGDKGLFFVAGLAVGSDSKPFVGGAADGFVDVGMGLTASQGYPDVFLGKIDASGTWSWGGLYGDENSQIGASIAVDSDGNVVMTGHYNYDLNFYGACALLSTTTNVLDVFVAKFNSVGACQWAKSFGNENQSLGMGVTIDSASNVVVVGRYKGTMTVEPIPTTSSAEGMGTDSFLVVLDRTTGEAQLVETRASTADDSVLVAADEAGGVFWAGTVVGGSPAGGNSMFVKRLFGWETLIQSSGSISVNAVEADDAGHVLLTGMVTGDASFGGVTITGDAEGDAFVLSLDSMTGLPLAATTIGGDGLQYGAAIRHDPKGGVVVLGSFGGALEVGCEEHGSAAGSDVFVVKLGP